MRIQDSGGVSPLTPGMGGVSPSEQKTPAFNVEGNPDTKSIKKAMTAPNAKVSGVNITSIPTDQAGKVALNPGPITKNVRNANDKKHVDAAQPLVNQAGVMSKKDWAKELGEAVSSLPQDQRHMVWVNMAAVTINSQVES